MGDRGSKGQGDQVWFPLALSLAFSLSLSQGLAHNPAVEQGGQELTRKLQESAHAAARDRSVLLEAQKVVDEALIASSRREEELLLKLQEAQQEAAHARRAVGEAQMRQIHDAQLLQAVLGMEDQPVPCETEEAEVTVDALKARYLKLQLQVQQLQEVLRSKELHWGLEKQQAELDRQQWESEVRCVISWSPRVRPVQSQIVEGPVFLHESVALLYMLCVGKSSIILQGPADRAGEPLSAWLITRRPATASAALAPALRLGGGLIQRMLLLRPLTSGGLC